MDEISGVRPAPEETVTMGQLLARVHALETENARLAKELKIAREDAAHDSLTGLLRRKPAEEALERQLASVKRGEIGLAVVIIDLDHFKAVNDTDGHGQGDKVLKDLAEALNREKRESDTLARWGGEEFLLIMPVSLDAKEEEIDRAVGRFHQAAGRVNRRREGLPFEKVTFSAGAVLIDRETPLDLEQVIALADLMLYQSKENGRDQTTITIGSKEVALHTGILD